MTTFLAHKMPAICVNQRNQFFDFRGHGSSIAQFQPTESTLRHARQEKAVKSDTTITELIRYNLLLALPISGRPFIVILMLRHVLGK